MSHPSRIRHTVLSTSLVAIALLSAARFVKADAIVVTNAGFTCFVNDSPGLHTLTVFHRFNAGAVASRFKIEPFGGMTMTYVSETHAFASTGNMRDGISMCYDWCYLGDTVLGTITYQGYGTSTPCAQLVVKPHPGAETLDVVDCGYNPKAASTFPFEVMGVQNPGCNLCHTHSDSISYPGTPQLIDCAPLPVESATCGSIKALYK